MNQENVNKLVGWIRANQNYPVEQLRQSALQGGSSEENFNAAMNIVNTPIATLEYKGVGIRFFALVIDSVVFSIIFWLFIMVFGSHSGECHSNSSVSILSGRLCGFTAQLYFLVIIAYYIILEWKLGGTIGKLVVGIRVIKPTGESMDLKSSLIRNIMRIVDLIFFYLVGAISIWNSKTKQRIGDKLAKTVVVAKNSIK